MPRRRRSKSPEYIQLQPYRALVGMPVNRSRFGGMIHAFLTGFVKAALISIIPICLLLAGYSFLSGGVTDWGVELASQGAVAAVLVVFVGLIAGAITAARR